MPRVGAAAVGLLAAFLPALAAAQARPTWELGIEAGYGPRFERSRATPPPYLLARNDVGHAYSTGLTFGRQLGAGILAFVVVRTSVPSFEGETAVGGGLGVERRVIPTLSLRVAVTGGYKLLSNNSCECGGLEYQGPWGRAEVGARYFLLHLAGAERTPRPAFASFDVFVAATVGFDAVAARYPDGSQYGLARDDQGWRLGPDGALGVGFVW